MTRERIRDGFMPWAGLALGTMGFFLSHQIGSDSVFQDCHFSSPAMVVVGAVLGLITIALGVAGAWRVYGNDSESPARKLVAIVGLMACALYTLGIALQLLGSLMIPQCWA